MSMWWLRLFLVNPLNESSRVMPNYVFYMLGILFNAKRVRGNASI